MGASTNIIISIEDKYHSAISHEGILKPNILSRKKLGRDSKTFNSHSLAESLKYGIQNIIVRIYA